MSISDNDYMKAYTLNSSEKKIKQIQSILERKFGEGWRRTLFMALIVIVATILLIIFGINTKDSPYAKSFSHVKVFFIVLLLSISFFIVWASIKPNVIKEQTGIVPFPPGDTLVPVDQTQCGIVPLECTNEGTALCDEKCAGKNGASSLYGCREIKHPNTYYLGTKLQVGKKYCLPQIAQYDSVNNCGTYTGRIVWSQNPDGTLGWRCQCLYPGLFSGEDCTKQLACMTSIDDRNPVPLKDKDGNVWSSKETPLSNTTPYDSYEETINGKKVRRSRFKCNCPPGYYSTDDDPFSCVKDICYAGEGNNSLTGELDKNTMKCKCDSTTTYKSNISGFCYPVLETDKNCNLNVFGDGCMYGIDPFNTTENVGQSSGPDNRSEAEKRIVFLNNGKYYISDLHNKSSFVPPDLRNMPPPDSVNPYYSVFIDITEIVNNQSNGIDKSKIIDISKTILKDAFYSFPVKASSLYSRSNSLIPDIKANLDQNKMREKLNNIAINASKSSNPGIAKLCNSYFYRRNGENIENCNQPLNKTGSEVIFENNITNNVKLCGMELAKPVVNIDNYPYGYNCDCGDSGRKQPPDIVDQVGQKPNICFSCIKPGDRTPLVDRCCNIAFDQYGRKLANFRGYTPNTDVGYVSWSPTLCGPNKDTCCFNPNDYCTSDDQCARYSERPVCGWKGANDFSTVCCPSGLAFYRDFHYWCSQLGRGENCKYDTQCGNGKCGRMADDENDNAENPICCPHDSYITKTFDWCNNLDRGERCKHSEQCKSGKCTNKKCE